MFLQVNFDLKESLISITVQLLHKLSIRGVNGPEKLLKVIKVSHEVISGKPPLTRHNRTQSLIISLQILSKSVRLIELLSFGSNDYPALSGDSPTQRLSRYLPTLPPTYNLAVFVGAMARGKDDFADACVDQKISISDYPLSASVACGKVCCLIFYSVYFHNTPVVLLCC